MFIRAHEAGYMCAATLSEKGLPVLASGRCPYKLFSDITFVNVTDRLGNPVPDGPHRGSKAGRLFHNKLIADLTNAENKLHAIDIIETHHSAHMRLKGCI